MNRNKIDRSIYLSKRIVTVINENEVTILNIIKINDKHMNL
jgi:hypothetical protein